MNDDHTSPLKIDKKYWRSLEDLADDPGLREKLRKEFPEWSDEPAGMDRRGFLSLMGASLLLAGLAGCRRPEEKIVPYVSKPEEITLGNPQQYATSMPLGTENYSLLVTSHEGRPTKISGNALNKASRGSANVWANASVLGLYDPDRSQSVLNNGAESTPAAFVKAWSQRYQDYLKTGGEGLAVLSESYASPTLARLEKEFRRIFPKAIRAVYEPVSDEKIMEGMAIAAGRKMTPVYDFEQAEVVLSLDADFLGTESRQYANARGFVNRRRVASEKDVMNRLYLVESTLSQTSLMADHRMRIQARQIGAFAAALALELHRQGLPLAGIDLGAYGAPPFDGKWISAVAKDLLRARGKSLILAGRRQPAELHALVAALNAALGNTGASVSYKILPDAAPGGTAELKALVEAMKGRKVAALVILGGNPVYNAPADFGFEAALGTVDFTVHHCSHVNETSRKVKWHLPCHHYLESWGDVSSIDGHLGIIQPLIAPLFEGFSPVEILALLAAGKETKGYDEVKQTWRGIIGGAGDFEKSFRRVLHDGIFPKEIPAERVSINGAAVGAAIGKNPFPTDGATKNDLEILFQISPVVHDGRFGNVGWLQEFPDPVTKVTWDNVAVMSEATAKELGYKNHQIVRLTLGGREIALPVWIMPGQADYSVTVALGYGRIEGGRIANGVGASAYILRAAGTDFSTGLSLAPIPGEYKVACVQDHHGLDSDMLARQGIKERLPTIVREATLEEYRKEPGFAKEKPPAPLRSMWDEHTYDTGHQWGMSIDLNACVGCGACTIACQSENNIPIVGKKNVLNGREMHWIRIDRYFSGTVDAPEVRTQPVACMQCEMAPCEQVCPVAATSHDDEGLNAMAYNRCIGTRYCSNNCPYKVRRFNFYNYTKDMPEIVQMAMNPEVTVRFRGVMEKCTYCTQRINIAKIGAKRDGRELRDGDIVTACEEACPTSAIVFGDLRDAGSRVVAMKKQNRDYALLEELNIRPRTTYLAKLRNPNPDLEESA